jgi:hypothetical protein
MNEPFNHRKNTIFGTTWWFSTPHEALTPPEPSSPNRPKVQLTLIASRDIDMCGIENERIQASRSKNAGASSRRIRNDRQGLQS